MINLTKREKRMARRIEALERSLTGVLRIVNETRPISYEEAEGIIHEAYRTMEAKPHKEWCYLQ